MIVQGPVVVHVIAYQARRWLEMGTLESIVAAADRLDPSMVVVFHDNYSRDGSLQFVAKHHPNVVTLMSPRNLNYGPGVNVGLQFCDARYRPTYFILVDADMSVDRDTFVHLIDYAERNPDAGMIQPLVKGKTNPAQLYSCGHAFDSHYQCQPVRQLPSDLSGLADLPSCSLASTLLRADALRVIGLLDPVYELYYESSDLAFRLRSQGYRCACAVAATAYHDGGDGTGIDNFHARYYVNRNRLLFWRIHNADIYGEVRARELQRYEMLQAEFRTSRFGLDPEREAVRRGLEDGLRLSEDQTLLPRPHVRLNAYDKASVLLVGG